MVATIIWYKFEQLSLSEIESMLDIPVNVITVSTRKLERYAVGLCHRYGFANLAGSNTALVSLLSV